MIKDKDLALKLLMEKADNDFLHTYEEISEITGYSSRQLKRWMKPIREKKGYEFCPYSREYRSAAGNYCIQRRVQLST